LFARLAAACVIVDAGQVVGLRRDVVVVVHRGLELVELVERREDFIRVVFVLRVEIKDEER
jgi:hypothetical protein